MLKFVRICAPRDLNQIDDVEKASAKWTPADSIFGAQHQ